MERKRRSIKFRNFLMGGLFLFGQARQKKLSTAAKLMLLLPIGVYAYFWDALSIERQWEWKMTCSLTCGASLAIISPLCAFCSVHADITVQNVRELFNSALCWFINWRWARFERAWMTKVLKFHPLRGCVSSHQREGSEREKRHLIRIMIKRAQSVTNESCCILGQRVHYRIRLLHNNML